MNAVCPTGAVRLCGAVQGRASWRFLGTASLPAWKRWPALGVLSGDPEFCHGDVPWVSSDILDFDAWPGARTHPWIASLSGRRRIGQRMTSCFPRRLWRGAAPSDKGEVRRVDGAVAMLVPTRRFWARGRLFVRDLAHRFDGGRGASPSEQQTARPQRLLTASRAATLVSGEQGGGRVPGRSSVAVKRYKVSGEVPGMRVSIVNGIRIAVVLLYRVDLQARRRDIRDGGLQLRHGGPTVPWRRVVPVDFEVARTRSCTGAARRNN